MTWTCGAGSLRQRRPGVWEVRVALGPDLVSGRSAVRSVTVHGDRQAAEHARQSWAAQAALVRSRLRAPPGITVAELLRRWIAAEHAWRPSTVAGYRSTVGYLVRDELASGAPWRRPPSVLRAVCAILARHTAPDSVNGGSLGSGRRDGPGETVCGNPVPRRGAG